MNQLEVAFNGDKMGEVRHIQKRSYVTIPSLTPFPQHEVPRKSRRACDIKVND